MKVVTRHGTSPEVEDTSSRTRPTASRPATTRRIGTDDTVWVALADMYPLPSSLCWRVDMKLIQELKRMQGKAADGVGDFIHGTTPLPTLDEAEDMIIEEAIRRWRPDKKSVQELADHLGVSKQYLYRRQREGKIDLKSSDKQP